jgi:hypothetical protein
MKYKKFKDLVFEEISEGMTRAQIHFNNKYGVSVIKGKNSYTTETAQYELLILKNKKEANNNPLYETAFVPFLTEEDVEKEMRRIQRIRGYGN